MLYYGDHECFVFDGYKYIRARKGGGEALYHLASDPGEQHSQVSDRPDVVSRARVLRDGHADASERLQALMESQGGRIELDEDTIRRLKALGYM